MKKPKLITGFQAAHFERRAEEIFGSRLVSYRYHNRFIEVKFRADARRDYLFGYMWCFCVSFGEGVTTIYIHDWFDALDEAVRKHNPFYME